MMNSTKIVAYECGVCKKAYFDKRTTENCCKPYHCEDCGVETRRYWTVCDSCITKRKYEKVEKLTKWDGWVYWEGHGCNDGYFSSLDELLEYCYDNEIDQPKWVFVCKKKDHKLNLSHAIDDMLDDAYDGAADRLVDVGELEDFIDRWNDKQDITTYYPDWSKVLLLEGGGE